MAYNESTERPSDEMTESPDVVAEEGATADVSEEFKARVDDLLANATPAEMEYLHSKLMPIGEETTPAPDFNTEGMPE